MLWMRGAVSVVRRVSRGEGIKTVIWNTIEEGDANAHEEGDDDEAEASAEGVNESEPVNPTL